MKNEIPVSSAEKAVGNSKKNADSKGYISKNKLLIFIIFLFSAVTLFVGIEDIFGVRDIWLSLFSSFAASAAFLLVSSTAKTKTTEQVKKNEEIVRNALSQIKAVAKQNEQLLTGFEKLQLDFGKLSREVVHIENGKCGVSDEVDWKSLFKSAMECSDLAGRNKQKFSFYITGSKFSKTLLDPDVAEDYYNYLADMLLKNDNASVAVIVRSNEAANCLQGVIKGFDEYTRNNKPLFSESMLERVKLYKIPDVTCGVDMTLLSYALSGYMVSEGGKCEHGFMYMQPVADGKGEDVVLPYFTISDCDMLTNFKTDFKAAVSPYLVTVKPAVYK